MQRHSGYPRLRVRTLASPAACLLLAGCGLLTTVRGRNGDRDPPPPARTRSGLLDLKGVVHCHSRLSHDSPGRFRDIVRAARRTGMHFVVMTDHTSARAVQEGLRGRRQGVLFVVGAELRTPAGGLLAFPLRAPIRGGATLRETLAAVHDQGAIALIDHAEEFDPAAWSEPGLDGAEVVNFHAQAKAVSPVELVARFLLQSFRTAFAAILCKPRDVFDRLDRELVRRRRFALVAGHDTHENVRLLGPLGWVVGTYEETFAALSTHVLAERLDERALVEALAAGRTWICYDLRAPGEGFELWAERAGRTWTIGDTVPAASDLELHVHLPRGAEIRVLRDGRVVARRRGRSLSLRAPRPGTYRVEVWLAGRWPWIFSGALRIVAGRLPPEGAGRSAAPRLERT